MMRLIILWLVVTTIAELLGLAAYGICRLQGFDIEISAVLGAMTSSTATFFIAMWGARVSHHSGEPSVFLGH